MQTLGSVAKNFYLSTEILYTGLTQIPKLTLSYVTVKVTKFVMDFFFKSHHIPQKILAISTVVLWLKLQDPNIDPLFFLVGRVGACFMLIIFDQILFIKLSNENDINYVSHSKYGFTFSRNDGIWAAISGYNALMSTLFLRIPVDHRNDLSQLFQLFFFLFQTSGNLMLGAGVLNKLQEFGLSYKQRKIIEESSNQLNVHKKILIIDAKEDKNGVLFPRERHLEILSSLAINHKIERVIANKKEKLRAYIEGKYKKNVKYKIIWFRTHGNVMQLLFSNNYCVQNPEKLKFLDKVLEEKSRVVLDACCLAAKLDENSLSFAEELRNVLKVQVYASETSFKDIVFDCSDDDYTIELWDGSEKATTIFKSPLFN